MQSTQKGWVVVGVAALLGLHAIGTMAAQRTSDTPQALAQQEGPIGNAAAPPEKTVAPQSLYEAMAERVPVGGYASFRYETNDLQEFNNGFDFRRFVLALNASPAQRLHCNCELECERFSSLEIAQDLRPARQGCRSHGQSRVLLGTKSRSRRPGCSMTSSPG